MNERLLTAALAQGGVFAASDATRVGVGSDEISRLIRGREIMRVRRGAYVLTSAYAVAKPHEQYLLRVRAVLRSRPDGDRASHHSALALHGVARYDVDERVVEVESRSVQGRRTRSGLVTNPWSNSGTWRNGTSPCVSVAQACVQVAAGSGFMAGLCAMDSALHLKRCTRQEIQDAAGDLPPIHRAVALRALAAADELCESPGETRTRIILIDAGFTVVSQFEVPISAGNTRRGDFLVDGCVLVEFDGLMKYEGLDGKHNLAAEKLRERELNRLGYEIVRLTWRDLRDPALVIRLVREARALAMERRRAMARARG